MRDGVSMINGHIDEHKMTDDEKIVKALGCLSGKVMFCKNCPYTPRFNLPKCKEQCAKDAIRLINRQQAEIESLSITLEVTRDNLGDTRQELNNTETEIERLKKAADEAVSCFHRMESLYNIKCMELKVAKAEAIKEFAESLKYKFPNGLGAFNAFDVMEIVDDLVKEMT